MTKNLKRILTAALALLLLCQALLLTACKNKGEMTDYTVTVKTIAGTAMADIGVYLYADASKADMLSFAKTDAEGKAVFSVAAGDGYVAVLDGVPAGYKVAEAYPLAGTQTDIVLEIALRTDVDLSKEKMELGDVMFDFTVTDTDGKTHTLSELLKTKKAVVLNFWYTNCGPCKAEFPFLQEAYAKYSDTLEVLALNPVDKDNAAVAKFKKDLNLTLPMAVVDAVWESAFGIYGYPTTVVIDRYGVIGLVHSGSIDTAKAFEDIFATYTSDNYSQTVVDDIDKVAGGAAGEALEFGGVTTFDVEVEPGKSVKCNVYKVSGMNLELASPHAQVEYEGKTYQPENGKITFKVVTDGPSVPVVITIGNTSNEKQKFTVNFTFDKGTLGDPYTLELGDFTAKIAAGNDQGVYYTYKATKDGTLTLSYLSGTAGVGYGMTLYNLDTYAQMTLDADGSKDAAGNPCVSVKMKAGNTVQVIVATLPDDNNAYPAAEFKLKAAFVAGDVGNIGGGNANMTAYSVTVKDTAGKAVAGAYVSVTANGKTTQVNTDKNGVASFNLAKGNYTFTLSVPTGYTASTTTLNLTADKTSGTLTVAKKSTAQISYTVTVKDEAGKAVSGATVAVGGQFGITGKDGKVTLKLVSDTYPVYVSPPSGYETPASVQVTADKPNATVTLKKGSSGNSGTKKTYTVSVVDASGKALTDVVVLFLQNGSQKDMKPVNSSGTATAELPAGNYTVTLNFKGTTRYYDKNAAVLTSSATTLKMVVADKLNVASEDFYKGNLYPVSMGSVYVELVKGAPNYFIFTPEKSGLYRVSTSHSSAVLSYWGNSVHFAENDLTASLTKAQNGFDLNVSEGNLGGGYVLAITGSEGCILTITRVGDYIPTIEDLPWSSDWMKDGTPKKYTLKLPSGKKLVNVDITASSSTYKLVYNDSDGFYHIGTKTGPILLMRLGEDAPDLSFQKMLESTGVKKYFYDSKGEFVKKEDYTSRMAEYVAKMDSKTGVYPVTKDLMYIVKEYGEYAGWWDGSENALLSGYKNLNKELAWMFACCYIG
ncbi:MAG: redoxin domain-containing protein [Clostridia bacterium]|nr:redoxin domain-containing protein [Clostridia bacterium]